MKQVYYKKVPTRNGLVLLSRTQIFESKFGLEDLDSESSLRFSLESAKAKELLGVNRFLDCFGIDGSTSTGS